MRSRLLFSTALEPTRAFQSLGPSSSSGQECEERAYRLSHRAQSRCVRAYYSRLRSNRQGLFSHFARARGTSVSRKDLRVLDCHIERSRDAFTLIVLDCARTDKGFQSLPVRGTSVSRRAATPLFNKLTSKFKIVLIKN